MESTQTQNALSSAEIVTMQRAEALEKFHEYKEACKRSHSAQDRALMQTFKALSEGRGVINVPEAIKQAGVWPDYKPKLAIMRADQEWVYFRRSGDDSTSCFYSYSERYYLSRSIKKMQAARLQFSFPRGTLARPPQNGQWPRDYWQTHKAPVPPIPPAYRPADAFSKYCILWEVEKWEAIAPVDPILLKPLAVPGLYVVVAHWDLSPVERLVMGSLLGQ